VSAGEDAEMSDSINEGRHDVSLLLGGCGDIRQVFATLLDAADCPEPQALRLRIVLNDLVPEAVARAYVLLALLDHAADALPSGADLDYDSLPDSTVRAVAMLWHVYQSPTLCAPMKAGLDELLAQAAAAPAPQVSFVQCSPGTWAQVTACLEGWAQHTLSVDEGRAEAKRRLQSDEMRRSVAPAPAKVQVCALWLAGK
jgi:Domain of unknown function (DUF4470)